MDDNAEGLRAQLEALILSGALRPGDRLNELALSARFGVSRGQVREAVRSLEEARLVQVIANRGAFVRKIDLAEALELFDIRAGLARSAGRLAVLRSTRAQIRQIQEIHRQLGAAAEAADMAAFHQANLAFHAAFIDAAANARLRDIDLAIRNEMQLHIRDNVAGEAQMRLSHAEHGAIVAALVGGDADACGAAFEQHILNGKRRLMDGAPAGR